MTARRLKIEGRPVLKLSIHDFSDDDVPFLDGLGIDTVEDDEKTWRYILIHGQEDFLGIRAKILDRYEAVEKGPKVFLERK